MNRSKQTRVHPKSCLCAMLLLLGGTGRVSGDQRDPTSPSPQIMAGLAVDHAEAASGPITATTAGASAPQHLRLKGIVLRDDDHGMALIAGKDNAVYFVTLRRGELPAATNWVNIGGAEFMVQEFSHSYVVLHSLDGQQQYTVR